MNNNPDAPQSPPPVAESVSIGDAYKEGLELAYPLALESYKLAERRMEVVEKRLQDLLAFAISATLGIIAVCAGKLNLNSPLFILAMLCGIAGIAIGVWARLVGGLMFIAPKKLYERYLVKSDSDFKLGFVARASEHDEQNSASILTKAKRTNQAAICFLFEAVFLGWWAMSQSPSAVPRFPGTGPQAAAGVAPAVAPKVAPTVKRH